MNKHDENSSDKSVYRSEGHRVVANLIHFVNDEIDGLQKLRDELQEVQDQLPSGAPSEEQIESILSWLSEYAMDVYEFSDVFCPDWNRRTPRNDP